MAKHKSSLSLAEQVVASLNAAVESCDKFLRTDREEPVNDEFEQLVTHMEGALTIFRDLLEANPPRPREGKTR